MNVVVVVLSTTSPKPTITRPERSVTRSGRGCQCGGTTAPAGNLIRNVKMPLDRQFTLVENLVADQLEKKGSTTYAKLRSAVKRTLRCDGQRASEAIDDYLARNPEMRDRVSIR